VKQLKKSFFDVVGGISSPEERPPCASILQLLRHRAIICSIETCTLEVIFTPFIVVSFTSAFFDSFD
jgi:hypothetical protein